MVFFINIVIMSVEYYPISLSGNISEDLKDRELFIAPEEYNKLFFTEPTDEDVFDILKETHDTVNKREELLLKDVLNNTIDSSLLFGEPIFGDIKLLTISSKECSMNKPTEKDYKKYADSYHNFPVEKILL
jgi:hypothetical protein